MAGGPPGSQAQLILDATGYLTGAAGQLSLLGQPARLVDTRASSGYQGAGQPMQGYNNPRCYTLAGQGGIPGDAAGVIANVTAVGPFSDQGWLTAWPAWQPHPATSNLNYTPGQFAIANTSIIRLGGGQACVDGFPGTNVVVDAVGFLR